MNKRHRPEIRLTITGSPFWLSLLAMSLMGGASLQGASAGEKSLFHSSTRRKNIFLWVEECNLISSSIVELGHYLA